MAFHIPDMMEYRNALPVISPMTRDLFAEHYSQEYELLKDRNGQLV